MGSSYMSLTFIRVKIGRVFIGFRFSIIGPPWKAYGHQGFQLIDAAYADSKSNISRNLMMPTFYKSKLFKANAPC